MKKKHVMAAYDHAAADGTAAPTHHAEQTDHAAADATDHAAADDDLEYWKHYIENEFRACGHIPDYDLIVTHAIYEYVNERAYRKAMWLYAIDTAKHAWDCFVLSKDEVDHEDLYFERLDMAEEVFDDVICGNYNKMQQLQVFRQNLSARNIFADYADDPCHAAAKERVVIHVLAVHMIDRNYTKQSWLDACVLCKFLSERVSDFEADLLAIKLSFKPQ